MANPILLCWSKHNLVKLLEDLHQFPGSQLPIPCTLMYEEIHFCSHSPWNKKWPLLIKKVLFSTLSTLDQPLELEPTSPFATMLTLKRPVTLNSPTLMVIAGTRNATSTQLRFLRGKKVETTSWSRSGRSGKLIFDSSHSKKFKYHHNLHFLPTLYRAFLHPSSSWSLSRKVSKT